MPSSLPTRRSKADSSRPAGDFDRGGTGPPLEPVGTPALRISPIRSARGFTIDPPGAVMRIFLLDRRGQVALRPPDSGTGLYRYVNYCIKPIEEANFAISTP